MLASMKHQPEQKTCDSQGIRTWKRGRRGILSMELVITLPILATILFALFEFSLLFAARSDVVEASRAAARVATFPGSTTEEVERAALNQLGPRMASAAEVYTQIGSNSGDSVVVTVIVPARTAAPDLLWPIGISIANDELVSETHMTRE